jgi:hypothetical protein
MAQRQGDVGSTAGTSDYDFIHSKRLPRFAVHGSSGVVRRRGQNAQNKFLPNDVATLPSRGPDSAKALTLSEESTLS